MKEEQVACLQTAKEDSFVYLQSYPEVKKAVLEVQRRMDLQDWDVAVQKMRTALQRMVDILFGRYSSQRGMTLDAEITALANAQIISAQSAAAYYQIKNRGNEASHETRNFEQRETEKLYAIFLEETLIFAKGYMKYRAEGAEKRLAQILEGGKPAKKSRNILLPPILARLIGVFYMVASVAFFSLFKGTATEISGGDSYTMFAGLVCLGLFGIGLYSAVTGSDRLILLNALFSR